MGLLLLLFYPQSIGAFFAIDHEFHAAVGRQTPDSYLAYFFVD
jgi:hypothetical protein